MDHRTRWIIKIKELRGRHGINILEAERLLLSQPHWRNWVDHQINNDAKCRKMALSHMKYNGRKSLIYEGSEGLKVRKRLFAAH